MNDLNEKEVLMDIERVKKQNQKQEKSKIKKELRKEISDLEKDYEIFLELNFSDETKFVELVSKKTIINNKKLDFISKYKKISSDDDNE